MFQKLRSAINRFIPKPYSTMVSWEEYNVDYEKFAAEAYHNPFIKAAVNEIITDMKSLPKMKVYTKSGGNYKESSSSSAKLVNESLRRPNKNLSYSQFIEAVTVYLMFGGSALFYKTRGALKKDVYVYNPSSFSVRRNENTLDIDKITIGEKNILGEELKDYHMAKVFSPFDSIAGIGSGESQIKTLALIGDMSSYMLKHNNSMLKNGGRLQGIFWMDGTLSSDQTKEFRERFKGQGQGYVNAGEFAFMRAQNAKFEPMSVNPKDLDWIQGMVEIQKVICRVLGVPETLVFSDSSSYNNLKEFKRKIYEDTIIPLANFIAEELTELFRDELAENEEIYLDTSSISVLRGAVSEEIGKLAASLEGRITNNDFIALINDRFDLSIKQIDKELGSKILVKSSMTFLDELVMSDEDDDEEKKEDY